MKYIYCFLFFLLLSSSCSKVEYLNSDLPDVSQLDMETIRTNLPVINIEVDQQAFDYMYFNFEDEIFVDARISGFQNLGDPSENNGNRSVIFTDRPVTLEMKGASSSYLALKSIGVTFDESLDNVAHPLIRPQKLLPGHHVDRLKMIRLRNSGNDFTKTMIKDMAYTQLAIDAGLNVELRYFGGATQVFINNQYLGILNLRTESLKLGIAELIQVDTTSITHFRVDDDNGNLEFEEGNQAYADQIIRAIKTGDGATLWRMLDVPNFIDYIIYQDYTGNIDWPHNNARAYSVDGSKLRFILFDLDVVAYQNKNALLPELEYVSEDIAKIYRALRKVDRPGFDQMIRERQKQLYQHFSPSRFNQIVDELAMSIADDMHYQISKYHEPEDYLTWKRNLDLMKREFERRDHFMRQKYKLD